MSDLYGHRSSHWRFDLFDKNSKPLGTLDGVTGGSLQWNANSQVKGGGSMTVVDDGTLSKKKLTIEQWNNPVATDNFEGSTNWAANNLLGTWDLASSVTYDNTVASEGFGSTKIVWANPTSPTKRQWVGRQYTGLTAGQSYTVVMRVRATGEGQTIGAEYAFTDSGPAVPLAAGKWETIAWTFTPKDANPFIGVRNTTPSAGDILHVDRVVLYAGRTTDYNGNVTRVVDFSWDHVRIKPVLVVNGAASIPFGLFIPSAPGISYEDGYRQWEIELLERATVLAEDYFGYTYSVPKGTNVIARVEEIINDAGEQTPYIDPDSATTSTDQVWDEDKSKLTIINDLLDSAGYLALYSDAEGHFRVQKNIDPEKRATVANLQDDENGVYAPDFTFDKDTYGIPNRVVLISNATGDVPALTATATNEDPDDPYSFQGRGRWITKVEKGIEVTSQSVLQDKARQRLRQLATPTVSLTIKHAPLPRFRVNNVVHFRRNPASIDARFVISATQVSFDETALAQSTITKIVGT